MISPSKYDVAVLDNDGNRRGLLKQMDGETRGWYHVYSASGLDYWGAGTTLQAATDMVYQKSGMAVEELPPVKESELKMESYRERICGFQGGGFYRITSVYLGEKLLGTIQYKSQPARYISQTLTSTGDYCVIGHDLAWLCRQHGLRLEKSDWRR